MSNLGRILVPGEVADLMDFPPKADQPGAGILGLGQVVSKGLTLEIYFPNFLEPELVPERVPSRRGVI